MSLFSKKNNQKPIEFAKWINGDYETPGTPEKKEIIPEIAQECKEDELYGQIIEEPGKIEGLVVFLIDNRSDLSHEIKGTLEEYTAIKTVYTIPNSTVYQTLFVQGIYKKDEGDTIVKIIGKYEGILTKDEIEAFNKMYEGFNLPLDYEDIDEFFQGIIIEKDRIRKRVGTIEEKTSEIELPTEKSIEMPPTKKPTEESDQCKQGPINFVDEILTTGDNMFEEIVQTEQTKTRIEINPKPEIDVTKARKNDGVGGGEKPING